MTEGHWKIFGVSQLVLKRKVKMPAWLVIWRLRSSDLIRLKVICFAQMFCYPQRKPLMPTCPCVLRDNSIPCDKIMYKSLLCLKRIYACFQTIFSRRKFSCFVSVILLHNIHLHVQKYATMVNINNNFPMDPTGQIINNSSELIKAERIPITQY